MTTKWDSKIASGKKGYLNDFSPIELQIIELRGQGKTHKEIAEVMGKSLGTIRTRITVINEKIANNDAA